MKDLICPLCALPFVVNPQGAACANRHQFDRAKEGYFNLLPVHHKNSREPGDAREQLIARREFLAAGYFLPLVEELKKVISTDTESLLDIGCGEGYFTRLLADHVPQAAVYGIDIAKAGLRLAGKQNAQHITFVVASSHSLPVADASMQVITRIYAPSKDEELARVLQPHGQLIIVTPGEQHLLGVRKKIYSEIKPHVPPPTPAGFYAVYQSSIEYDLNVPPGDLTKALLQMTPFAWKLTPELSMHLQEKGIVDRAHFRISIFQKVKK